MAYWNLVNVRVGWGVNSTNLQCGIQFVTKGMIEMTVKMKGDKSSKRGKQQTTDGQPDYERLIETDEFKQLVKKKKKFMSPYVIAFFGIYLLLPILTGYTSILENRAIGWMTWTWVYAFGMFVMVWVFTQIYVKKSREFDTDVEQLLGKHIKK